MEAAFASQAHTMLEHYKEFPKDKDKYCVLFGRTVWCTFDTAAEAMKQQEECEANHVGVIVVGPMKKE